MECRLAGETNRSSPRRKPAPAPLLSITKSHMTRLGFEPGAAAVGSRRPTAGRWPYISAAVKHKAVTPLSQQWAELG
jgi:hypothetical protein